MHDPGQNVDLVECPKGTYVTGGCIDVSGIDENLEVGGSFPAGNGWGGRAINDASGQGETMRVSAICRA